MTTRLLRIVTPPGKGSFVAGAIVGADGHIIEAAPILCAVKRGLCTGRDLRTYAARRGWSAEYIG